MKNTTHRTEMLRANSLEVRVAARGGRRIAQPSLTTTTFHTPAMAARGGKEITQPVLALVGQPWSASSFATWEKGVPGRSTGLSSERSGQFVRDVGDESTQPALSRSYCTRDADSLKAKREGKCTT